MKYQALRPHFYSMGGWLGVLGVGGWWGGGWMVGVGCVVVLVDGRSGVGGVGGEGVWWCG